MGNSQAEHEMNKLKEFFELYITMFLIGLTTFGGGYAMISIIQRELVEKKKWISEEELMDYVAIAQITPGIVMVNTATFVGYKKKGVPGGIVATLGVVTPSIIIITIIASVLINFADNEYVKHAFAGIRVCVSALIVNAVIGFMKKSLIDILTIVTFIGVLIVSFFTSFSTVYIVLCVIAISIIITLIKGKEAAGK